MRSMSEPVQRSSLRPIGKHSCRAHCRLADAGPTPSRGRERVRPYGGADRGSGATAALQSDDFDDHEPGRFP